MQPVVLVIGCPCSSCPRTKLTVTFAQSTVPSSGSVTVTWYGNASPKLNTAPFAGLSTVTVGAVLPTVMTTVALPKLPAGSRTVSFAE